MLRPVYWDNAPFAKLQTVPVNAEPVTEWSNRDAAFNDITRQLNQVIPEILSRRALEIQRMLREAGEHTRTIRYQEALDSYEQVLRLEPINGLALFGRARTLFLLQQIDASIEALTLAEQIAPGAGDNFFSQLFKARTLSQRERYVESLEAYNRALSLDPKNVTLFSEKATILIKQGIYEQALNALEQARYLEPNNVEYVTRAGELLFRLRRFEQALTMYEQANKIQPDEASHHEWQGRILLYLERSEDALTAYQHALALSPQVQYYVQIGKLFLQVARFQEALVLYEQAIKTNNEDNSTLHAGKGRALLQLERYDEALACYQTAIELSKPETDPQFYHDLGALYERLAQRAYVMEQQQHDGWQPEAVQDLFFAPAAFNPAKLALFHTLKGHTNYINGIAISPDGTILASSSSDKTVKLWELPSGRELRTLTGHTDSVTSLIFNYSGVLND